MQGLRGYAPHLFSNWTGMKCCPDERLCIQFCIYTKQISWLFLMQWYVVIISDLFVDIILHVEGIIASFLYVPLYQKTCPMTSLAAGWLAPSIKRKTLIGSDHGYIYVLHFQFDSSTRIKVELDPWCATRLNQHSLQALHT